MDEIKLRFKLDMDRIEFGQFIGLTKLDYGCMRDVLALSLVNGDGDFIDTEKAMEIINTLKMSQAIQAANEFARQVQDTAVNPQNGANSSPP